MKKFMILAAAVVFSTVSVVYSADSAGNTCNTAAELSSSFYPIGLNNILYLKGYKKDNPSKEMFIKAEVIKIEKKDGNDYYYFFAPQVGVRYLVRETQEGIEMRVIKYPFPFFGFSIEVDLKPAMTFLKYPLKVGEKWNYKGKAEATVLFIKLGREISTDFEIVSKETIKLPAGEFEAYHITAKVDEGDGKGIHTEKYWYAKGLGYSRADTSGHFAELVGYKIFDEKTGKFAEKIPDGVEKYE
ncbi:MAG: hypothetical protein JXR81_06255 [Candidatus Goldbacteria bacterium]|nr:hypothetical protein [Candidatus Goldiibacteriota bacterium]